MRLYIGGDEQSFFKAEGVIPEIKTPTFASRDWIQANDEIYWLKGVFDKPYYNGNMACAELIKIPSTVLKMENTTEWSEYIEPDPQIVMFPSGHEYLVSPWWNI